ncbi:hypothetical protein PCE1_002004 [Barthelona sp. PCE]
MTSEAAILQSILKELVEIKTMMASRPVAAGEVEEISLPKQVKKFNELIVKFGGVVTAGAAISDDMKQKMEKLTSIITLTADYIYTACLKGNPTDGASFMAPLGTLLGEVAPLFEVNRKHPHFGEFKVVNEFISLLTWVAQTEGVSDFIEMSVPSVEMWGNKLIKAARTKEDAKPSADWYKELRKWIKDFSDYVEKFYPNKLNFLGKDDAATEIIPVPGAGTPAPAAEPKAEVVAEAPKTTEAPKTEAPSDEAKHSEAALLSEISQGFDITKALKSVKAEVKAAKKSDVAQPKEKIVQKKKTFKKKPKEPVVYELIGTQFKIENHMREELNCTEVGIKHDLMIYNVKNTVIHVPNTVRSVFANKCQRLTLVLSSSMGQVEFINSKSCEVHFSGVCPLFLLDNVQGLKIVPSIEQNENYEVQTTRCSDIIMCRMEKIEDEKGEERLIVKEFPIAYVHSYKFTDGQLVNNTVEIGGE